MKLILVVDIFLEEKLWDTLFYLLEEFDARASLVFSFVGLESAWIGAQLKRGSVKRLIVDYY